MYIFGASDIQGIYQARGTHQSGHTSKDLVPRRSKVRVRIHKVEVEVYGDSHLHCVQKDGQHIRLQPQQLRQSLQVVLLVSSVLFTEDLLIKGYRSETSKGAALQTLKHESKTHHQSMMRTLYTYPSRQRLLSTITSAAVACHRQWNYILSDYCTKITNHITTIAYCALLPTITTIFNVCVFGSSSFPSGLIDTFTFTI